jgi:MoaA/NifB/PqqE/SkfB family radical SAM enzyme
MILNNFILKNFPYVQKFSVKYKFIFTDLKSLLHLNKCRDKKILNTEPSSIVLCFSTFCNANCNFCANKYLKDKREVMGEEVFEKSIEFLKRSNIKRVSLTPTIGDSLIDPKIYERIARLKEEGFKTYLYTNFISLKKNDFKKIMQVDELHLDLGDIYPQEDKIIFGIDLSVSKERIKKLLSFLDFVKKSKKIPKIFINFRSMRNPREVIKSIKNSKFYKFFDLPYLTFTFLQCFDNWGGIITKKSLLGNQTLKISPKIKILPCQGLYALSILPNGDIRLCGCRCLDTLKDELVIGNVKSDNFEKISLSENWKEILLGKIKPKVCKECSFYKPLI